MEQNDLPNIDVGGDTLEDTGHESISTQESEQEQSTSKTPKQLEEERSRAVAEMFKFMNKEKEARAELSTISQDAIYLNAENAVLRDNGKIVEVYQEDPELAEKICQTNWGVTYTQLIQAAQGKQESSVDLDTLVERKLSEREKRAEMKRVEMVPIEFLADKGLTEKSPLFQQVIREYNEFPAPATANQAKKLISVLYKQANGDDSDVGDIDMTAVRTPSSGTRGQEPQQSKKVSPQMRRYMEEQFGSDYVKKFLSTK